MGGKLNTETMAAVLLALALKPHKSELLCRSLETPELPSFTWAQSECLGIGLSVGEFFYRTSGFLATIHLTLILKSPLIFTVACCGDSAFQHWKRGMGILVCGWDLSLLRKDLSNQISLQISNGCMWVWDQPILYPCPSYQYQHGFFFIFSYSISVQLIFTWFSWLITL